MGKRQGDQPRIPDAVIFQHLKNREALDDDLWLVPEQVGMLLGRTDRTLEEDRKNGTPPPFKKPWGMNGPVRYTIGAVRDVLLNRPSFNSTLEANIALSFGEFLDTAGLDDTWPFLIHQGVPVDLFRSLTLGEALSDDDRAVMLTLDEYLTQRHNAARERHVNEGRATLGAAADEATAEPLPAHQRKRSTP
ncbi:hypothetical protein [Burkholderia pseudomultivorans]|uniref:DNA-binding protein n=1 Tax=Burkholderia pseudomultivorans TaxID=1207504 RepID=A0ABU2EDT2_9BURK|nr:hypothetical protein [Burkholderia pseudomultivorans]MDR8731312.1 hypothetical protein [Burkholderia pseudomultivorans]MDR8738933.1 hypothetical protein [Burkholderia pseudomultivorans]MDR8745484.1 hypothetical protein [Burkholderia pseudomultivorans]MDR8757814.1 hypothetical protein [Burkholderia pseudomultivorans]MDR8781914.1 hypothetical protein [Burkholderia pseudomultivorans]